MRVEGAGLAPRVARSAPPAEARSSQRPVRSYLAHGGQSHPRSSRPSPAALRAPESQDLATGTARPGRSSLCGGSQSPGDRNPPQSCTIDGRPYDVSCGSADRGGRGWRHCGARRVAGVTGYRKARRKPTRAAKRPRASRGAGPPRRRTARVGRSERKTWPLDAQELAGRRWFRDRRWRAFLNHRGGAWRWVRDGRRATSSSTEARGEGRVGGGPGLCASFHKRRRTRQLHRPERPPP